MIALTFIIISTVIGAGFATGAELIAFFGTSTLPPHIIALFVGVCLFFIMLLIFWVTKTKSKAINRAFAPVYFIFFTAMTAGITELAGPVTSLIAIAVSIAIVQFGFNRMATACKIMILFALIVLFFTVILNPTTSMAKSNLSPNIGHTILWSILYSSMNCCTLVAIFESARRTLTRNEILISSFLAVAIISFFIVLVLTAIHAHHASTAPMPILAISDSIVVKIAIFLCVLTSMFATLFNIAPTENTTKPQARLCILILLGITAYGASFLGFTKVVGIFYPITGALFIAYILIISFCSFWKLFRHKSSHQNHL